MRRYLYPFGRYPADPALVRRAIEAAAVLEERILRIDLKRLDADEFHKSQYLQEKYGESEYNWTKYAYHLAWVLSLAGGFPESIVLVDHGGGTGFQGLLAKAMGVGTVVYNDIDPKFLGLAQALGEALGLRSDHYVCGDIDRLIGYVREHDLRPSALVSYDVMEHIYDMEAFLGCVSRLTDGPIALFMSSGANMFSPRYVLRMLPIQMRAGRNDREARRKMIASMAPHLTGDEAASLANATRSMARPDIARVVGAYREQNRIVLHDRSRTNRVNYFGAATCNPETGYWAEHFLNPFTLRSILRSQGFGAEVRVGYFWNPLTRTRRAVGTVCNLFLRVFGLLALPISPYYTLAAQRGPGLRPNP